MSKNLLTFIFIFFLSALQGTALAAPLCSQIFTDEGQSFQLNDTEALGYQFLKKDLLSLDHFFMMNQALKSSDLVDLILEKDLRSRFFNIESIMLLYSDKDSGFFKPLLRDFKDMEDKIGSIALHQSLRDQANGKKQADLVQYFENQISIDRKNIEKSLENFNIHDNKKSDFKRIAKKLEKYDDWKSPKKDRQFLLKTIASYTKDLRKSIQKMQYDDADIEKGLHKLRRRIRWITMQVKTLEGLVYLDAKAPVSEKVTSWYAEMSKSNPKMLSSHFMAANAEPSKYSIVIPLKLYAMLNQIVSDIGLTKDRSETEIYFKEAIQKTGSKASIDVLEIEDTDHQKLSQDYQNRINQTDLIGDYLKTFENLNSI